MAVASASFNTSMLSISEELRFTNGLVPVVALTSPPNVWAVIPFENNTLVSDWAKGTPSIIYKGSVPAPNELLPRTVTLTAPPAIPLVWVICNPGNLPLNASIRFSTGFFLISSPLIFEMELVVKRPVVVPYAIICTSSNALTFVFAINVSSLFPFNFISNVSIDNALKTNIAPSSTPVKANSPLSFVMPIISPPLILMLTPASGFPLSSFSTPLMGTRVDASAIISVIALGCETLSTTTSSSSTAVNFIGGLKSWESTSANRASLTARVIFFLFLMTFGV